MQRVFVAGLIGLVFGTGIALSGMANPAKVLNFFDIAGTWDPSLAIVMGGALLVTATGYWFVLKRSTPVLAARFHLPAKRKLDAPLLAGSAVFGIGWGNLGVLSRRRHPGARLGRAICMDFRGVHARRHHDRPPDPVSPLGAHHAQPRVNHQRRPI